MKKNLKILFIASAAIFVAAGCNQNQVSSSKYQVAGNQNQSPSTTVIQTQSLTVTETVEGSNLNKSNYQIAEGKNALDLLKSTHQVTTKEYSGIGEFVESIDGIKPDNKHFWAFYVNGASSNVGASAYILKDNDKIEWKLEAISGSGY